jgi:hypothetical protein
VRPFLLGFVCASSLVACGARSDLGLDEPAPLYDLDSGMPVETDDASVPPVADAAPEATPDVTVVDANPPPVMTSSCVEAGITYVYAITEEGALFRFYPPSATFDLIGYLDCVGETSTPFSMGVDRSGIAWVEYSDGTLFRVDTANAHCMLAPYPTDQRGWNTFGMGFAANTDDGGETLYVAESSYSHPSLGLGYVDFNGYFLRIVGPFKPALYDAVELTGTGDGRLYAFSLNTLNDGSKIAEVDPSRGTVKNVVDLPTVGTSDSSFAFAYWGGDFYLFTGPGGGGVTEVDRYRPSDGSVVNVAVLNDSVVGVGVSTCAPE